MITRAAKNTGVSGTVYAVASDFCRIFSDDMDGLYQLSLCLTADPAKAEQCFVSGLEDSRQSNRVFKEWARSWARRTIIQNAIRLMRPARKHEEPAKFPLALAKRLALRSCVRAGARRLLLLVACGRGVHKSSRRICYFELCRRARDSCTAFM